MATGNVFAFDPRGAVIVLSDDAEVLVHGGDDERPLWRRTLSSTIVGLGAASDTVAALDTNGELSWFRAMSGEPLETATFEGARALVMAANGRAALLVPGGVAIVARGREPRRIDREGATAVAFSRDGGRIAIGTSDGNFAVFGESPTAIGAASVGAPIRSVAWNANGFWICSAEDRVYKVTADGMTTEQMTRAGGMSPDCLTCSEDGAVVGLRLDAKTVVALVLPSKDTVGQFIYLNRAASGVAFGPGYLLGIGLAGGDGNIMDLVEKGVRRTDTHPGREHNRWMLEVSIHPELLPRTRTPAAKNPSPPTQSSAGASPERASFPVGVLLICLVIAGVLLLIARMI